MELVKRLNKEVNKLTDEQIKAVVAFLSFIGAIVCILLALLFIPQY